MYNVTLLGKSYSGKTAFCSQLSGSKYTSSYLKTIEMSPYYFPTLTIYDTPSGCRFGMKNETLYEHTHLFLLMVNDDYPFSNIYNSVYEKWPNKDWVLLLNGNINFHSRRRWALSRDIRVFQFDIKMDNGIFSVMDYLIDLSIRDPVDNRSVVDLRLGWEYLGVLYSSCV